jgi:hypothetical protein
MNIGRGSGEVQAWDFGFLFGVSDLEFPPDGEEVGGDWQEEDRGRFEEG